MDCFICQEKHWPPRLQTGWWWALVSERVLIGTGYQLHTLTHFYHGLFSSIQLLFPLIILGTGAMFHCFSAVTYFMFFVAVLSLFVILLLIIIAFVFSWLTRNRSLARTQTIHQLSKGHQIILASHRVNNATLNYFYYQVISQLPLRNVTQQHVRWCDCVTGNVDWITN